jgi:DNA (cytosine-5)-methyltransferase 1
MEYKCHANVFAKACNQYQKANSIKNSLLTTYLSYVDHYRPRYFLLENVQSLLDHRLGSSQVNIHRTRGGIEMGSAKFIMRALTSLGYQVQFSVLQAAEHGTPQSRYRVFFWGSMPGYPLPKYPEPTHVFSGNKPKVTRRTRRSAPYHTVSVGDAISDLPAFEWKMKIKGESADERLKRDLRGYKMAQVSVTPDPDARNIVNKRLGDDVQVYDSQTPLSEYQRELRRNVKDNFVYNAYTSRWKDETMERILRIPMRPGANHLDLPEEQDMYCLRSEQSAAARHSFYPDRYRRLDYEKTFQTCLTKIDPSGKNGNVSSPFINDSRSVNLELTTV